MYIIVYCICIGTAPSLLSCNRDTIEEYMSICVKCVLVYELGGWVRVWVYVTCATCSE